MILTTPEIYHKKIAAGGCCNLLCQNPGQHEYAVWWKCQVGHREELKYCQIHGPEHFLIAQHGAKIECHTKNCNNWMSPLIEGYP